MFSHIHPEQRTAISYAYLNLQRTTYDFFPFDAFPGGRDGRYLNAGSPLPISRGVGGGGGWLGPSLSSVLAGAQVGAGDRGQPLHMTTYLTSRANIPQLYIPNVHNIPK
jgi:hypothetical protein